jgi:hypothetical protein
LSSARPANSIHRATITIGESNELPPPEPLTMAVPVPTAKVMVPETRSPSSAVTFQRIR